ncbi:hypothetical protein ACJMK2_022977 [Sinanodonta woodiana]|uniref:Prolow-density lipoprotein receptor-related protein 1-like beta-propeller domain-containing protein n=1 Tax=Sinanodonta woodiana TaxID=1069815 RepID=A0ABD3TLY7_SINWO
MNINTNYSNVYIGFSNWIYSTAIDYDPVDHVMYWVSSYGITNNRISSGALFGNSEMTVRSLNDHVQTGGITVDSISRLLFYTDWGNHMIVALHIEDSFQKTVISSGLFNPRAVVSDPINGTIYWADSGSPAKIEKSDYDGTNRHELVNTGLSYPYGLALDINDGVLYWCEIGTFTIERVNVDGSNRSLIYKEQISLEGCSIAVYHSYLYYTTWGNRHGLMRIGTDGRGLICVASSAYILTQAIHVHIHGRLVTNGCSNVRGGCSHLCFPLPGGNTECACPDLMTLQGDRKTCRQGEHNSLVLHVCILAHFFDSPTKSSDRK